MYLLLDTTNAETKIMLFDGNKKEICTMVWQSQFRQSEELLAKIEELLSKNSVSKKNLKGIIVNPGPGSYTGVRIGLATANLLAFSLDVPVFSSIDQIEVKNTKGFREAQMAVYQNDPIITKEKSRL